MTEIKKITRAEVAEHNNNKSAWVIIDNNVYDVTKFLDEHPGGCEVLIEQSGSDATEAFEDVGHSTDAREMRESYLIANIVDEEKQTYSFSPKTWAIKETTEESSSIMNTPLYPLLFIIGLGIVLYFLFG